MGEEKKENINVSVTNYKDDYLSGKKLNYVLNPENVDHNKGGFTIRELANKFNNAIQYIRKRVINPLRVVGLISDLETIEDNLKEKRFFVDKKGFVELALEKAKDTPTYQETEKLIYVIYSKDKITATILRNELNYSWDKAKNMLNKLEGNNYLIKHKTKDGKEWYEPRKEKFEEIINRVDKEIVEGLKEDFGIKDIPPTKEIVDMWIDYQKAAERKDNSK